MEPFWPYFQVMPSHNTGLSFILISTAPTKICEGPKHISTVENAKRGRIRAFSRVFRADETFILFPFRPPRFTAAGGATAHSLGKLSGMFTTSSHATLDWLFRRCNIASLSLLISK